jgi:hypothetical protein
VAALEGREEPTTQRLSRGEQEGEPADDGARPSELGFDDELDPGRSEPESLRSKSGEGGSAGDASQPASSCSVILGWAVRWVVSSEQAQLQFENANCIPCLYQRLF